MSSDWLVCVNLLCPEEDVPSSAGLLRWVFEHGLRPTESGTVGQVLVWTDVSDSGMPRSVSFDEFVREVEQSHRWYFKLWLPDEHLSLELTLDNLGGRDGVPDVHSIRISVPKARFQPAPTQAAADERANGVVRIASRLADYVSAVYGFGGVAAGEWKSEKEGVEATLDGDLSTVYWFNYYSDGLLADRVEERVLSAPADRCEVTPSGSVLLIPDVNPIAEDDKRGEVSEYLGL